MDSLPYGCVYQIERHLSTLDKVNLKLVCKSNYFCVVIKTNEKLIFLLRNLIANVGRNYEIRSCGEVKSNNLHVSYMLNIYINSAIFFQKLRTQTGIELYVRIMTLDRRDIKHDNIRKIVENFKQSSVIECCHIEHPKVDTFVEMLNTHSRSRSSR